MVNDEIRIKNLRILVEKFETISALANASDTAANYLSQILNRVPSSTGEPRGIGNKLARKLEVGAGLYQGWMDVNHDSKTVNQNLVEHSNAVSLPLLNISASMGEGENNYDEIVVDMLRVSKSWIDKNLSPISDIRNLSFIHAIGDSMMPSFNDGDILLVDVGIKTVSSDSVYVIEAHERLFIKRVRRRLDGNYEISSDNPAVKTVDTLNGNHQVTIKGRVVWVWNGRKV